MISFSPGKSMELNPRVLVFEIGTTVERLTGEDFQPKCLLSNVSDEIIKF